MALGSHEMGAQLLLLLGRLPKPSPISSSRDNPDLGGEDAMDMESCVRSASRSGWSMNWRSSLRFKGFTSESEHTRPNSFRSQSWRWESLGLVLERVVVFSTILLQREKNVKSLCQWRTQKKKYFNFLSLLRFSHLATVGFAVALEAAADWASTGFLERWRPRFMWRSQYF